MQKILDRTQESLAHAFASLAQSAKRQQRLYLATIGSLMLIVVIFTLLLAVLAATKQLDYRRALATQNAADIRALLHREQAFLARAELTLAYYNAFEGQLPLPEGMAESVQKTGAARSLVEAAGAHIDLLIGDATRAAWGPQMNTRLWRLYQTGVSTLATEQAFALRQRAMLVGLNEDYAVMLPAADAPGATSGSDALLLQPATIGTLRDTIERQLQAQTGKRVPGKGERIWLGPYRDPLQGVPVITAVSAYYSGGTPVTLITTSIPVSTLPDYFTRPAAEGTLLITTPDRRVIVSSPPVDAGTSHMLSNLVANIPADGYRYTRDGAVLVEPLAPDFGALVGYLPWRALVGALRWQLATLAGLALLVLGSIALTARLWGLRLLQKTFAETTRALESETINHILVSATPIGLCIVRQSDFSILTANALADELLHIEAGSNRLPPHIVGEFSAQAPDKPSLTAFAKVAAFVAPARPLPSQSQSHLLQPVTQAATQPVTQPQPDQGEAAPAQFLQFTYAAARYADEDVLFCAILDVTAQHALEQQLRLAQQTSESMMRARSNFFASMSHEIRTPLNALLGNLELFARTPGLEAHTQRLATLEVAAGALRRIVNDILDFSKIDAGEMRLMAESFRPIDDFENIALSYAPMTADRAIRFYSHLSPTLDQTLRGDRTRIAQIVNNLLSNAFKFTSCGKITLSAEVKDDLQGRPILTCRVCDSGIGMDQALVARIFNPFEQGEASTSSRYGGTGLGLSICARLCELMGGHITVESVLGVGSAFSASIPLALPPDELRVPAVEPTRRGSVLVLCQERESGQLLDGWLQRAGWSAHTVTSTRSALAWLRVNRPQAMLITGEYSLDAIAGLRAVQPVGAAWITRTGPHRPAARGEGVLEATEFSRTAILSAIELAAEGGAAADSAEALAGEIAEALPPAVDPALHGLTVLVAEDNPLIQTLIVEQLDALGCLPTIAGDGRQALAAFELGHFEVVLTDIHMPVMDGYGLLAALRKAHADLPVLAFSAVTDNQQRKGWRERGFTGYVAKPASLGELETALLAVASAGLRTGTSASKVTAAIAPVAPTTSAAAGASADPANMLSADDKTRYTAMLKQHLQNDLPRLMAIVEQEDRKALGGWAHSAGGAFLVVQERQFAQQCRELQRLCENSEAWTTEMDERAISLHEAICDQFGLDEASMH